MKEQIDVMKLTRWNNVTDQKYPMNTLLKAQLDIMDNLVHNDYDCIVIVDGEIEGSGKSVLAQQMAYYWAHKNNRPFTVDNIIFSPKQFMERVQTAQKYDVILWDEAYDGQSKYRQMAGINQTIMSLFQKIRQLNLFIILVLPYFFDLNSYIGMTRSWFLVHVILQHQLEVTQQQELDFDQPALVRGFFRFFSRKGKKQLFLRGRREYDYESARGSFIGNFPKHYTVDEEAYKAKKLEYAFSQEEKPRMVEKQWVEECFARGMSVNEIKGYVSYSLGHLYAMKRELDAEEKGE